MATTPQPAAGPPQQARSRSQFDVVERGGYHRGQVDEYFRAVAARIRALEHDAARVAGRAGHDAASAVTEALHSPDGRKAIEDLMRLAADEIEGNKAAAAAEGARLISDATATARQIIADATREADGLTSGARQQADSVLASARDQAKQATDEATARATAVSEAAGRRLSAVAALHQETLRRIGAIRDVTDQLVQGEQERGPVEDEVERAVAAALARPALTATAG